YSWSVMDEPAPAPVSTSTSWPARTSSCAPAGVIATRYSWFLTSLGTPTFTALTSWAPPRPRGRPDSGRRGRRTAAWSQYGPASPAARLAAAPLPGVRGIHRAQRRPPGVAGPDGGEQSGHRGAVRDLPREDHGHGVI